MVDYQVPAIGLAATLKEVPTIQTKFEDLVDVFLADKVRGLPVHGPQDLALELQDRKQPPRGPINNLSKKELVVLL